MLYSSRVTGNLRSQQTYYYNLLKKKEFRWIQLDGGKYRISKKSFDDWLDNLEQ